MITVDEKTKTFRLYNGKLSYVMQADEYGYLRHLYFGARIGSGDLRALSAYFDRGFSPTAPEAGRDRTYSHDTIPAEFGQAGRGDFRTPALAVRYGGGMETDLKYDSCRVYPEKPPIAGMPSLRGGETLEITLRDDAAGLCLTLHYTLYDSAVTRRATLTNIGGRAVRVHKLMSGCFDFEEGGFELITLMGRHCGERQIVRRPLLQGISSVASVRGASSHQANPFAALVRETTSEDAGEAYGFNLVYSGNFLIEAEVDQFGCTRLNAGIHPAYGETELSPGEAFAAPELVAVYSAEGLGGMSRAFHDLYRDFLIDPKFARAPRPIVINNWESTYFEFDEKKLSKIIADAKGLGIDTFVLDDGWFGRRDNDESSLGDWFVDERKLPGGLDGIIEACKKNGMRFGLWFEPEMISEDSELFRAHPDWCVHTEGYEPVRSRYQYVLDFSRREAVDHIYAQMEKILSAHDISYVKWDMNRHLTDVPEAALYHRYVLGVYDLYERLRSRFPDLLIEGCSGGGGRFDPAILYYSPQIWTSDNTDAYARTFIQYGTSLCYPLSAMSNHVSICPNHQTGHVTPFASRGRIASLGAFGYELNPSDLTAAEREQIRVQTEAYRRDENLILSGDLYRLVNPFESDGFGMSVVSKDKRAAYAVFMRAHSLGNMPSFRLRFKGLDPNLIYRVDELGGSFSGSLLMNAGLAVSTKGDYATKAYHLTAEE